MDWAAETLAFIDDHQGDIVDHLVDLVRLPSISGTDEENEIQGRLATDLTQLGLEIDHWQIPLETLSQADDFPGMEVARSEAWGLVGVRRGNGDGQSLLLNAHVDVVPPGDLDAWGGIGAFDATISDGAVHGRGTCDMKGGLVSAWWATKALLAVGVPLKGDLIFGTVQAEEDGGMGTYAMLERGWRADACVIPEPTSLDLGVGNAGALTFRLSVPGLATHASRRTGGVSAIEKFLPIFNAVRRLETERNELGHLLAKRWDIPLPIEIGTIKSGDWASSVPDLLEAEGRFGVGHGESLDEARAAFETAIAQACADDPWLRDHPVVVEWWGGQFAPGFTDPEAEIARTVRRSHGRVSTHQPENWVSTYGSDLRLMTNNGGVPTVHYGPGDAGVAHGPLESVPLDEVLTTARTLALVAIDHCGVR